MRQLLTVVLCSLALTGCAGMLRDSTQMLEITSAPNAAKAELSTGQECITPCRLEVPRKNDIQVKVSLEGYDAQTVTLKPRVDAVGMAAQTGNVLAGLSVVAVATSGVFVFYDALLGTDLASLAKVVGGGFIVYLVVAANRDRAEGKLRSLEPNPLHIDLQPRQDNEPLYPLTSTRPRRHKGDIIER